MKIAVYIISLLLLLPGCSRATTPVYDKLPDEENTEGLVSIAYLKTLCGDRSTVIDKDVSFEATVIANDLYGEFYKTIVLLDGSGGIEVSLDKRALHDDFHLYSQVAVFCHGLALGRVGGKITLGAPPTGEYAVDRIPQSLFDRYIHVFDHADMSDPEELRIGELAVEHVSSFVLLRDVRLVEREQGLSWCDADAMWDEQSLTYTDRHFSDAAGDILTVRTLNGCSYGHEPIPEGTLSIAGIVDYADGDFFLRIADHYIISRER